MITSLLSLLKEQDEACQTAARLEHEFDLLIHESARLLDLQKEHPEWEEDIECDLAHCQEVIDVNRDELRKAGNKADILLKQIKELLEEA